jgi:hypothetical protein
VIARVSDVSPGAFAYVTHGGNERPAQFGQPIYIGDEFRTGPGTRLTLTYTEGGTVTLEPNVDPKFFQTAQCVVLNFFRGRLAVDASGKCVESQGSRVYQASLVIYEADPNEGTLTVTVVRGQAETVIPPGIVINEGQTLTLRRGIPVGRPAPAPVVIP